MVRVILGVIASYFVMMFFVFVGLTVLYLALGTEATFEPGTYDPTPTWLIPQFLVMFVAATIGGYVGMAIGRTRSTMIGVAVLAVVLGSAVCYYELTNPKPDPGPRPSEVNNMEAMMKAKAPEWSLIAKHPVGILGLLVGCRTRRGG